MNRKSIIATGAALVLLLGGATGAYLYVDHKKASDEAAAKAEKEALKLFSFNSNSVSSIDITNEDGHFLISLTSTGDWKIDDSNFEYDFTLNSYYLNVVASTMSRLTADHKAEKKGDLSKYGLDSPVTIVCKTAEKDYTVLVGSSSVTNEFCYLMLPDDDTIYCVDSETGTKLRGGLSDLRSPYMLNCLDTEIEQFSLEHNGEVSYDLSRVIDGNTIWQLNAPETDVTIDAITVNNVLTNMVRIENDNFECFTKDEAKLAEHGLDKLTYTFSVKTDDKTITLKFPDFSEDDEEIWGYDPDTCAVFSLSKNSAAFLSGVWQDLTAKQAMSVPFMSAESLEITIDGETHTLSVDHDKQTYIFDDIDVTAKDNKDASSNFEYLYASVSEINHGDFRSDIPEKMGEPTCTFRYKLTDGTKRELALVPIDDETYWAYIDGRCIGMTVDKTSLTGTYGCLSFIEHLNSDLGITESDE